MSERIKPGLLNGECPDFREAVCIDTDKIYDSCKDKDCLEDLRVYITRCGQELIDRAINVKCRKAEVIWVYTDIEPVPFNKGYYSVDLKYFFKITLDVFLGVCKPQQVEGLATFDKKVILFGSEGNAKKFSSTYKFDAADPQDWMKSNLPTAVVEVVDPICLGAKVTDDKHKHCGCDDDCDITSIPESVCRCFEDVLVAPDESKRVYISLGIFTIVRIERRVQLLIPAFDFCVPDKECVGSTDDNPCDLFKNIKFPVDEFFPPQIFDFNKNCDSTNDFNGCCN